MKIITKSLFRCRTQFCSVRVIKITAIFFPYSFCLSYPCFQRIWHEKALCSLRKILTSTLESDHGPALLRNVPFLLWQNCSQCGLCSFLPYLQKFFPSMHPHYYPRKEQAHFSAELLLRVRGRQR